MVSLEWDTSTLRGRERSQRHPTSYSANSLLCSTSGQPLRSLLYPTLYCQAAQRPTSSNDPGIRNLSLYTIIHCRSSSSAEARLPRLLQASSYFGVLDPPFLPGSQNRSGRGVWGGGWGQDASNLDGAHANNTSTR
jgi:hypothetical protein